MISSSGSQAGVLGLSTSSIVMSLGLSPPRPSSTRSAIRPLSWNVGSWILSYLHLLRDMFSRFMNWFFELDDGKESLYSCFKEEFWYCGVIVRPLNFPIKVLVSCRWLPAQKSSTAMGLLVLLSIYPIRQKAYEVFLALHVSLAVIALVTLF